MGERGGELIPPRYVRIVYTSNIFAILRARALYFALAAVIHRFRYLKHALAAVLVFIGGKIIYNQIFGKLDPWISLSVTFGMIAVDVGYLLYRTRQDGATEPGMDRRER